MVFSNWTSTNQKMESERTAEQALADLEYRVETINTLVTPHGALHEIYEALRDIQAVLKARV